MIRSTDKKAPVSEIEYPPSEASRARAAMISRMHSLKISSDSLLSVIGERIGAERREDLAAVEELSAEQERLIANMRAIARKAN